MRLYNGAGDDDDGSSAPLSLDDVERLNQQRAAAEETLSSMGADTRAQARCCICVPTYTVLCDSPFH